MGWCGEHRICPTEQYITVNLASRCTEGNRFVEEMFKGLLICFMNHRKGNLYLLGIMTI